MTKKILIRLGAAGAVLGLGGWAISSLFKGSGKVAATPHGGAVSFAPGTSVPVVKQPTNSGQAATVTQSAAPALPSYTPSIPTSFAGFSSMLGNAVSSVGDAVSNVTGGSSQDVAQVTAAADTTGADTAYQVQQAAQTSVIQGTLASIPIVGGLFAAASSGLGGSTEQQDANSVVSDVNSAINAVTGTMAPDDSTADETSTTDHTAEMTGL